MGSERQGAHRLPRRARHAGPQPGVDHQPRQCLLQPAAGCDADRPGAAPARRAGRQPATPQEEVTNDQGYIQLRLPTRKSSTCPPTIRGTFTASPSRLIPASRSSAPGQLPGRPAHSYGLGFAMGAFERTPFGLLAWGLDWLAHAILFDHANYYSHSTTVADWGLPHGGPRAYGSNWGGNRTRDGTYGANRSWNGRRSGRRGAYNQRSFDQRGPDQRGGAYTNRAPAQSYTRPAEPYRADPRTGNYDNRGYQQQYGYTHPALPAQNYDRTAPQQYARVAPQQNYGYRPQTYPTGPRPMPASPTRAGPRPTPIPAMGTRTGRIPETRTRIPETGRPMPRVPTTATPTRIGPIALLSPTHHAPSTAAPTRDTATRRPGTTAPADSILLGAEKSLGASQAATRRSTRLRRVSAAATRKLPR